MDRRVFLRCVGCSAAAAALAESGLLPDAAGMVANVYAFDLSAKLSSVEARHYKRLDGGGIECGICPRHCRVTDLERGYCGVRENHADRYVSLVYGLPCALNIDPIEKKPLFHFYPGSKALSLATAGCNVNCKFCQNWDISQSRPEQTQNMDLPPAQVVQLAREKQTPILAYTYSEPTVFYEYMYDCAQAGKDQSLKSVMISGGYIEKDSLADLLPHLDAIKVDLKSIREEYYKEVVGGELPPVLERLIQIKAAGKWLEIVNLVVPTLNDSEAEIRQMANWIKVNLGPDVPLHFSGFYPKYLLKNLPPTPQNTLETAHDIAKSEGLHYVYLGNLPGHPAESTYCPGCGAVVIGRRGFDVFENALSGNKCSKCERVIPGVF